jgi:hypothetical protein
MDADGKLALVLKSSTVTDAGTITSIVHPASSPSAVGLGLNSKGQVAATVRIDGGPNTLVLLTPQ